MIALSNSIPAIKSPHIYLPFQDGGGTSLLDQGSTGAEFTVADNSGTGWDSAQGFSGSNLSHNHVWTDDPVAIDVINPWRGAENGVGGQCVFLSFWLDAVAENGTLLTLGSTNSASSGMQMYVDGNGTNLKVLVNGVGVGTPRKIAATAGLPASGECSVSILLDFLSGDFRSWVAGKYSYPPGADRSAVLDDATEFSLGDDNATGITLLSRNTGVSAGSRTPSYGYAGKMSHFLAINLTNHDNPWRHVMRNVTHLSRSPGRLPRSLEDW